MKHKEAFLSIELLIGLMALTIFISVISMWQGKMIDVQSEAIRRIQAIRTISSIAERIALGSLAANGNVQEEGIDISWYTQNVEPSEFGIIPFRLKKLQPIQLIQLQGSWYSSHKKNEKISFVMSGESL